MAKKSGIGISTFIKQKRKKRKGRHSKKDRNTYRGQGRV